MGLKVRYKVAAVKIKQDNVIGVGLETERQQETLPPSDFYGGGGELGPIS